MKDNYTYPAIITENEVGGKDIVFPDFDNAITCASKKDDVVEVAQDYLTLLIDDYETTGKKLPESGQREYKVNDGMSLIYINVWMPYHRTKIKEVYVKKTLTIPLWIDILAKKKEINFSATLVKALKEVLDIESR